MSRLKTDRHGFTLIELLVVIAIIAILAAILFPVFAKAREKARQTTCTNNVKQMMMGILNYTQDFDEKFMPAAAVAYSGPPPSTGLWLSDTMFWQELIAPYTGNKNITRCPNSTLPSSFTTGWYYGNYGINDLVCGMPAAPQPLTLSKIAQPANLYVIFDSGYYFLNAANAIGPTTYYLYLPGAGGAGLSNAGMNEANRNDFQNGRHNGGVVVGFADGHVKWVTASEFIGQVRAYWYGDGSTVSSWNPAN